MASRSSMLQERFLEVELSEQKLCGEFREYIIIRVILSYCVTLVRSQDKVARLVVNRRNTKCSC